MKNVLLKFIRSRHGLPLLIIVLAVIAANGIYIFTSANPNPLLQRSGLVSSSAPSHLGGQNTIDPNDGFTSQALGHAAANEWLKGDVPYWNYNEGVGAPLAGEMQSAAFSPLTLLLKFGNGFLYEHLLLEMIAGIATYLLLFKMGMNRKLAIFGGVAFALNGTFAWLTNAAFNPIAFLPLLLLGIESTYQAAKEKRYSWSWLWIVVALAASLYAGFPETAYIDGLLALAWAIARFFTLERDCRKAYVYTCARAGVIGILLTLPILISFYDYYKYANVGLHAGSNSIGLPRIGLSTLFLPYIFGPIFGLYGYDSSSQLGGWWSSVGGYIGVSLVILAIIGLCGKKDRTLRLVLGGWAFVTISRTYGYFGIAHIINLIPGIKSTAFYRYSPPSFEFALVILAVFGIADLVKNRVSTRVRILTASLTSLIIVGAIIRAIPEIVRLAAAPHIIRCVCLSILFAFGVALGIFLFQFVSNKTLRTYALIGVVLVESFVLFMIPQLSTPRHVKLDTTAVTYLQHNLGTYRFATVGPIQPNYGSYYGIAAVNVNDLPIPKLWSNYVVKNLDQNVDPIIFTGTVMKDPQGQTPLEAFVANFANYESIGVKYLVAPAGVVPDTTVTSTGMKEVLKNTVASVYELPSPQAYFSVIKGNCSIDYIAKDHLTANCKTPSTLLRRELFMKGWTAKVDGKTVPPSEYQQLFQTIPLSAGKHTVSFAYVPPSINFAYFATLIGLSWLGFVFWQQRNKPTTPEPKRPATKTRSKST